MSTMKRILSAGLLLMASISAMAAIVEDSQVMYVGGTVAALKEGVVGKLDTTSATVLTFSASGSKLEIPFAKIDAYEYSKQLARQYGVLPTVAIGLFKMRQRRHFFRIAYHDESNVLQVAVFEVSKQMPQTLLAVLQARAPKGCKPQPNVKCAPAQRN